MDQEPEVESVLWLSGSTRMCLNILVSVSRMFDTMEDVGVVSFRVISGIYVAHKTGLGGGETLTQRSAVRLAAKHCQPNTSERPGRSSRSIWIVKLH